MEISNHKVHKQNPAPIALAATQKKNGHSQTEEGANLQAVGANLSEHVAQTLVNPDKSEGEHKIVQWDYFLYWPRSSSGKKSLYEKRVF